MNIMKKNTKALSHAGVETGLEVNAAKTKYMSHHKPTDTVFAEERNPPFPALTKK
jgi:hypothetical protein